VRAYVEGGMTEAGPDSAMVAGDVSVGMRSCDDDVAGRERVRTRLWRSPRRLSTLDSEYLPDLEHAYMNLALCILQTATVVRSWAMKLLSAEGSSLMSDVAVAWVTASRGTKIAISVLPT
jgi:hypothetical protein